MQLSTKQSRKRTKFQLDSDSDNNDVFMGFTHKGKLLGNSGEHDDFNEVISQDSDDDKNDRKNRKGFLNEEMVAKLNFGGGADDDGEEQGEKKKSRKEVLQEIMEKSKSYDAARKEMKQINLELQREVDTEFKDLFGVLKYDKGRGLYRDPETENAAMAEKLNKKIQENKIAKPKKPEELSFEQIAHSLKFAAKQQPVKPEEQLSAKEKAIARRQQLLKMMEDAKKEKEAAAEKTEGATSAIKDKREGKADQKREIAMAKMVKEQQDEDKQERKAQAAQDDLAGKIAS